MVKIIRICIISLFLLGCTKQYKYKIVGNVMVNDTLRQAIWYTDTISFKSDTAYYVNSNRSVINIIYPYKIYKILTIKKTI
jgi:hypothetical protein